jgi:hypothetical protein
VLDPDSMPLCQWAATVPAHWLPPPWFSTRRSDPRLRTGLGGWAEPPHWRNRTAPADVRTVGASQPGTQTVAPDWYLPAAPGKAQGCHSRPSFRPDRIRWRPGLRRHRTLAGPEFKPGRPASSMVRAGDLRAPWHVELIVEVGDESTGTGTLSDVTVAGEGASGVAASRGRSRTSTSLPDGKGGHSSLEGYLEGARPYYPEGLAVTTADARSRRPRASSVTPSSRRRQLRRRRPSVRASASGERWAPWQNVNEHTRRGWWIGETLPRFCSNSRIGWSMCPSRYPCRSWDTLLPALEARLASPPISTSYATEADGSRSRRQRALTSNAVPSGQVKTR